MLLWLRELWTGTEEYGIRKIADLQCFLQNLNLPQKSLLKYGFSFLTQILWATVNFLFYSKEFDIFGITGKLRPSGKVEYYNGKDFRKKRIKGTLMQI